MNNIDNLSEVQEFVKGEYEKFDLEKFLTGNGSKGAAILITDKQIIMNDCSNYGYNWHHEDILKNMYRAIYKTNDNSNDGWSNFEANVADDGNICLTLNIDDINTMLVFLPRRVTEGQYRFLEILNDKIKEVYDNNKECFVGNPLIFNFDDIKISVNNLDKLLDSLKKRINNNNIDRDEVIIGDTVDSFKDKNIKSARRKR